MKCLQFLEAALALFVVASFAGCEKSSALPKVGSDPDAPAAGCNLLLITLDTTRADHLGCYGWQRASTPALDALAQTGTRFEHAYANVPITLASHASMLTGTRPPEHGVRDNGRFALGKELPTLAEVFKSHGYQTAAFIGSSMLDSRYGLNRGFDTYDDQMPRPASGPPYLERRGDLVCSSAVAWLDEHHDKPFMCWVHFFDPHAPYEPPKEFFERTKDPYDGEIAFMDANVGRLLKWLDEKHLRDKTLVVVVGDHGESLGEHGYDWHALLVYDSTLHVPLIISLPGLLPKQQVCAQLAGVSDVMPTVLDLMGWETPGDVTGRSLEPVLRGGPVEPISIYAETEFPCYAFGWSPLQCLIGEQWTYIRAPKCELYDRRADPKELTNLAEARPDVAARLEAELTRIEESMVIRQPANVELDAETQRALAGLGYVGAPAPPDSVAVRRNPMEMLGVVRDFDEAKVLLEEKRSEEAIAALEPLAKASPQSFVIFDLLGKAYATAGRFDEARYALLDALALAPTSSKTYLNLAHVLSVQGRVPDAIDACRKAIENAPTPPEAQPMLQQLQASRTAQQQQIAAAQQKWSQYPSPEAALILSSLLDIADEADEAVAALRAAIERYPGNASLLNALAWLKATSGTATVRDGAEALRLAQEASRLEPDDSNYLDTVAAAYAEAGRFEEAVATMDRAIALAAGNAPTAVPTLRFRRDLYASKRVFRMP